MTWGRELPRVAEDVPVNVYPAWRQPELIVTSRGRLWVLTGPQTWREASPQELIEPHRTVARLLLGVGSEVP